MRLFEDVLKDCRKISDRIEVNEQKIIDLSMIQERREAAEAGNYNEVFDLRQTARENETEIIKLSEAVYLDKVTRAFLKDNLKVALYKKCEAAIKAVFTKYDGKPLGDKTRDKIRNELKAATGCYIWIASNEINISIRNEQNNFSIAEIRVTTPYDKKIITSDNKLNAAALEAVYVYEKYTEDPKKAARALIKEHKKTYEIIKAADAALGEYYSTAPGPIKKALRTGYISNPLYNTIQGI